MTEQLRMPIEEAQYTSEELKQQRIGKREILIDLQAAYGCTWNLHVMSNWVRTKLAELEVQDDSMGR